MHTHFLMARIISDQAIQRRTYWVNEIKKISGNFGDDYERLEAAVGSELNKFGIPALVDHLRLCGSIPEAYRHDSSEEKLYSKYTDLLLSLAFKAIGYDSSVLKERGDAADVEVVGENCSFVADAKAFRLSRTAKNQKDFKISAMDSWKKDKLNAMVVCPIYQLPASSSQIYHQATSRNVCIFTYSHLSLILCFLEKAGQAASQKLISDIFAIVPTLNHSKSAVNYWASVNKTMFEFSKEIQGLWETEKQAATEAVEIAKSEDLAFLNKQQQKIMQMSHTEALTELIKVHKIDNKTKTISSIKDSGLFAIT
ncbi:MAG TPA: HindIII family type II restriction endonuclease [Bacteroidia bacterium]